MPGTAVGQTLPVRPARAAQASQPVRSVRPARVVGESVQVVRSVVTQVGPQVTGVTVSEGYGSPGSRQVVPVLHVRAGAVFVYAAGPLVVAAYVGAWRDSLVAAGQVFAGATGCADRLARTDRLDGADGAGRADRWPVGSEVSVIVRQDAAPAAAVSCYPPDRTRPGRPGYVETVTGPLTVRSFDRTSIVDQLAVWRHAAALGALVWATPALADL